MKIEKLEPLGEQSGRLLLVLENGERIKTSPTVAADLGLSAGMELSEQTLAALREAVKKAAVRQRAARIVSATSISEKELRRRLVRKGESPEDADEAADWLKNLHFLDDGETAAQLARAAAQKGYGPARIRNILREKGIPQELWDEAMAGLPGPDGAIDRFLRQRFGGEAPDEKTVKKTVDALLRRGHSWRAIADGLRRYQQDLELQEPDMEEP